MTINFCGKLILDKSFYSMKHSDCEKIRSEAQKIYNTKYLSSLIPDTTFYAKGGKTKDKMKIQFGDYSFEIVPKKEVTAGCVLHQILLNTCFVNDKQPLCSTPKYVIKAIKEILEERFGNKS